MPMKFHENRLKNTTNTEGGTMRLPLSHSRSDNEKAQVCKGLKDNEKLSIAVCSFIYFVCFTCDFRK